MLVLLAVVAGAAGALQAALNAALARSTGLGPALVINTLVVLIGTVGLWAALGERGSFFPSGTSWTLYLGGLGGFMIIATLAVVFPKIGGAYAVALLVGGQCAAALVIDHFGLVGMPRDPVTLQRVAGVALACGGALLMRT